MPWRFWFNKVHWQGASSIQFSVYTKSSENVISETEFILSDTGIFRLYLYSLCLNKSYPKKVQTQLYKKISSRDFQNISIEQIKHTHLTLINVMSHPHNREPHLWKAWVVFRVFYFQTFRCGAQFLGEICTSLYSLHQMKSIPKVN